MPEAIERKAGELIVGDKVTLSPSHYYAGRTGVGTIVKVNPPAYPGEDPYYGVDFYPWPHGHNCGGLLKAERAFSGYNSTASELILVEPVTPPVEKAFYLVRPIPGGGIKDGIEPIPGEEFDNGQEAGDRVKVLSAELGTRVQVRRRTLASEANWKEREAQRMADGTYSPLPAAWDLEPIPDHFLHLSTTKKGFVAYTPDANHGAQDRQLSTKPGSYVAKFYPNLNAKEIGRYSAIVSCDGQLHFVNTAEEIKQVYLDGPDSCMSEEFDNLPCHPVEVYAAGDLALAYLRDDDDQIIARCVVWPEKKLFTRAYGDIEKIVSQLEAAGYERGNFYGARLTATKHRGYYVVPYIDECTSRQGSPESLRVKFDGDNLVITERGGVHANAHGSGLLDVVGGGGEVDDDDDDNTQYCPACEENEDADGFAPVVTGRLGSGYRHQNWCEGCRDNATFYCDGIDESVSDRRGSYEAYNGNTWSDFYVEASGAIECERSHLMYPASMIETVVVDTDGATERWGSTQADAYAFRCAATGLLYSEDEFESVERDGKTYAAKNLPEIEEEEEDDEADSVRAAA